MSYSNPAITLSTRISPELLEQLDDLSIATGRTKSFLASEAIENYLKNQAWQVKAIKKAVKKADSKNAKFVDHEKVVNWVNSWGNDHEKDISE